jgi:hypothetical protein
MAAKPLLPGADPNEKLARYLDAVRLFGLLKVTLNFRRGLFTAGCAQLE